MAASTRSTPGPAIRCARSRPEPGLRDTSKMLAHVTRLFFAAWLLAVAVLLALGRHGEWSVAARLGLGMLVLGHPFLIAIELVLARLADARINAPRPRNRVLLRAWAGEWIASTVAFGWRLPWRSNAHPDHLPKSARGQRGVVFIHGFVCNRGIWNTWLARLSKRDRAYVAVNLEPVFARIDDYVEIVERAVRQVEVCTGLAPVIVAHSMGGLVARAWLRHRASAARSDGHEHAARIITIGTPHRGTWMAAFAMSPNARQMRMGSDWLTALSAQEPATLGNLFTCWWSECDQIVFPPPTAELPGSEGRIAPGCGHVALVRHEGIWNDLMRCLDY